MGIGYMNFNPMYNMSTDAMNWFNMAYQYQPNFKANTQNDTSETPIPSNTVENSTVPMTSETTPPQEEKTKKGSKSFLMGTGLVATGALCLIARKKGGGSIKKGVKILWDSVKGNKQSMQLAQNGDTWVAKIGKPNVINKRQGDITEQALKLGLHANAPENGFKNAESKLARYTAIIDSYTVEVVNGKNGTKIKSYKINNEELKDSLKDYSETQKAIDDFIKKVESKDAEALEKLEKVTYSYKDKDGTVRWFTDASNKTSKESGTITSVITDKFNASEPNNTLSKYLLDNPKADERMKAIIKDGNFGDGVKVAGYEYNLDNVGKLKIENGEIIGITTKDDKFIPSNATEFATIKYNNSEAFEKALQAETKNCENVFYNV